MNYFPWLLLALPLIGFAVTGGIGHRLPRLITGTIGSGVIGVAFLVAISTYFQVRDLAGPLSNVAHYTWLSSGAGSSVPFHLEVGLYIDQLTSVMLLIVTGVGFLIHVYSIGYMEHDENFSRFFSFLNLFIFSMLLLVLADNYLVMLVGWGLVGLSSYLLIGFWFTRATAVAAARKAFVINVIGDFGVMIACYLMFKQFHTLSFATANNSGVFDQAAKLASGSGVVTAICLTLLVGAVAKSAQIPLYTWLPDAMEGPTPVSALIHAATMVTAGVYLIARSHVLYQLSPLALGIVAVIGAVTALFAATIGLVQTDIKRVLAYSTMSQIGYMFLACGVGAYGAGIFHLMTHAFFKAALFLGAGNIIHALHNEQDLRKMGGLRKRMPLTYWSMLVSCLAISGIIPLSGFASKDEILGRVLVGGGWDTVLWIMAVVTAGLTAFYMFRLFFMTFHGTFAGTKDDLDHVHEAPTVMIAPVMILAGLAVVGGFVQFPGMSHAFNDYLHPVFAKYPLVHAVPAELATNWLAIGFVLVVALVGIGLAYTMYGGTVRRPYLGLKPLHALLLNKYFIDEAYDEAFVFPIKQGAESLYRIVDRAGIDGVVNGAARAVQLISFDVSPVESGYVRWYALSIFCGAVLLIIVPLLPWFR